MYSYHSKFNFIAELSLLFKVRNEEQVKTAYENVVKLFGRVDVNVNCAGIAFAERPFGIAKKDLKPIDNFKTTIEVNWFLFLSI